MGNTQILETLDDEPDDTTDDVVSDPDDDTTTDPPADDTDPDVDDPDDEDEVLKSLTPEQRARFDEAEARASKANGNAKKWRLRATGKVTTPPVPGPPKPKPPAPAPGTAVDRDALKAELRAEFKAEAAQERIQGTARTALADSGLVLPTDTTARRKALAKAVRLLDLEGAEDEDDVDVAIAELKREMPGLFGKRTRSKPAGGAASGPRSQAPSKAKTKVGKIADLFD